MSNIEQNLTEIGESEDIAEQYKGRLTSSEIDVLAARMERLVKESPIKFTGEQLFVIALMWRSKTLLHPERFSGEQNGPLFKFSDLPS